MDLTSMPTLTLYCWSLNSLHSGLLIFLLLDFKTWFLDYMQPVYISNVIDHFYVCHFHVIFSCRHCNLFVHFFLFHRCIPVRRMAYFLIYWALALIFIESRIHVMKHTHTHRIFATKPNSMKIGSQNHYICHR